MTTMSNRTPLDILAARVKALGTTIGDIKAEYEHWLEAAQEFEHDLSLAVEKLDSVTDDLWSLEVEAPTGWQLADMAPVASQVELHAALPAGPNGKLHAVPDLDDEIPF